MSVKRLLAAGAGLLVVLAVLKHFLGGSPVVGPCERPPTPIEIHDALYTIFLEGARTEHAIPLPPLLPLPDAAERIFCDPDPARRRGRMRYAATKLAAGLTILRRGHASPARVGRFVAALARLQFPTVIVDDLDSSPATTLVGLERAAGRLIDDASPVTTTAVFQRTCCPCIENCDVGSDDDVAAIQFEVDVVRPVRELFSMIDPVSWEGLLPGYFTRTREIEDAPDCVDDAPVCFHDDGPCRAGTDSPPMAAPMPHAPGTPWCGLLHEQFRAQWAAAPTAAPTPSASFDNVLAIRARYEPPGATLDTATGYRVDYRLCEALGHTSGGLSGDCGVDVDCGFARLTEDGAGGSLLFATKHVSFLPKLNPDANAWAPIALEVMAKESALTLCVGAAAGEGPCECYRDECEQHREYEPTWPTEFCE